MSMIDLRRPLRVLAMPVGGACLTCSARAASVCSAVEDRDLGHLEAVAETVSIAPGAAFIHEGERSAYFFNVASGTARLFKLLPDGRRQVTGFADTGRFLGLAAVERYGFGAEAIDLVTVCRFNRDRLRRLMENAPALEERLLLCASGDLAAAQEQMLLLGRKTALERVASFLLEREAALPACRGGGILSLPMSRSDIADYLGLTVETVSRTLGTLKRRGLISIARATEIRIVQGSQLRALAAGES